VTVLRCPQCQLSEGRAGHWGRARIGAVQGGAGKGRAGDWGRVHEMSVGNRPAGASVGTGLLVWV